MSALRAPAPLRLLPARAARATMWVLRRVPPRAWLVLVALAIVLGGGWLWLRDSSLVAVQRVDVLGVSGPQAPAIRRAIELAAQDQTTLHVRPDALERAVSSYPLVRSLQVRSHPPHGLTVVVEAERPVATMLAGGRRVAVNAEGKLLPPGLRSAPVPDIRVGVAPAGPRVTDRTSLTEVLAAAAAPAALRSRLARIGWSGRHGLTVALRRGPRLFLGLPVRLDAKWAAAAAVLADPSSLGATYVDVRVPERPAAGDVPPAAPPASSATPPSQGGPASSPSSPPAP